MFQKSPILKLYYFNIQIILIFYLLFNLRNIKILKIRVPDYYNKKNKFVAYKIHHTVQHTVFYFY